MLKSFTTRAGFRSGLVAIVAVAAACFTTPALAADNGLMTLFDQYCVKTNAAMAPALRKAEAAGWAQLPDGILGDLEGMTAVDARFISQGDGFKMLFVGVGELDTEIGKSKVDMCFVADNKADAASILAATKSFTRVEPNKGAGTATQTMWSYVDTPAGRRQAEDLSDDQLKDALNKRTLRFVLFQNESGLIMVGYAIPRI
jgi:hypothetical protein